MKKLNKQTYIPDVAVHPAGMPPRDVIKSEVLRMGLTHEDADAIINYWLANGFRHGRNPVKSWTAVLRNWRDQKYFPSLKSSKDISAEKRQKQLAELKELRKKHSDDGENRLL